MTRLAIISLLVFLLQVPGNAQDTLWYGPNGRPVNNMEEAVLMKVVRQKSDQRLVVRTSQRSGDSWTRIIKQKIRFRKPGSMVLYNYLPGKLFPEKTYREMKETSPGTFAFEESSMKHLLRKGNTSSLLPLHLEGELTEYYPGGKVKSISTFKDNQLVTNRNWLPDGSRYIDSVYYSADTEPEYKPGPDFFRNYMLQRIASSKVDLSQISDEVVIGWVVMETGTLEGPIALKGKSPGFNQMLIAIIDELPGAWEPARLNGKPVRYFMSIPLNFIYQTTNFQELELTSGTLHYNRY